MAKTKDRVIYVDVDKNVVKIEFDGINQIAFSTPNSTRYKITVKKDNSYKMEDIKLYDDTK